MSANFYFTSTDEMRKLRTGDAFWINGKKHNAMGDAHISDDSTCDEYVVFDENGDGWFENDFNICNQQRCPFTYAR